MANQTLLVAKRGRGRPKQNGVQPGWMLLRSVEVMRLFARYRDHQSKFETTVNDTVQEFKRLYPELKINSTEVRRIHRAMFDPASGLEWTICETVQPDREILYGLQWRDRPVRTRRNAIASPASS